MRDVTTTDHVKDLEKVIAWVEWKRMPKNSASEDETSHQLANQFQRSVDEMAQDRCVVYHNCKDYNSQPPSHDLAKVIMRIAMNLNADSSILKFKENTRTSKPNNHTHVQANFACTCSSRCFWMNQRCCGRKPLLLEEETKNIAED